jgi:uncharacterized protein (DUF2336 family)
MSSSKLHHLIELASEPSSSKRRELLREVTNLFFTDEDSHNQSELGLFDDVLSQLTQEMEEAVRAELSERMSQASRAPKNLLRNLAADTINVAEPVLKNAASLSEEDQVMIAKTRGPDHLRALSQRRQVTSAVTEEIVRRGDDDTLNVLLRNETADLSRETQEAIVDRAHDNPALHEAVVDRNNLPPDLLNEMYFVVETRLRDRIMERNANLDPAEVEAALAKGRKRLAARDGALPADYAEAESQVRKMKLRNQITPQALANMLRSKQTTLFQVALAEMSEVDFHTARRILERKELDALAIICKAADFDRALFLTFAILILDTDDNAMARAREYGDLYSNLPRDSAMRTIRFWRMRRSTGDVAAA